MASERVLCWVRNEELRGHANVLPIWSATLLNNIIKKSRYQDVFEMKTVLQPWPCAEKPSCPTVTVMKLYALDARLIQEFSVGITSACHHHDETVVPVWHFMSSTINLTFLNFPNYTRCDARPLGICFTASGGGGAEISELSQFLRRYYPKLGTSHSRFLMHNSVFLAKQSCAGQ